MRRAALAGLAAAALAAAALAVLGPAGAAAPQAPTAEALALRSRGIAELENERPAEAEQTFRRLAALAPRDPLAEADLAVALLRLQRHDEALAAAERALSLAPRRGDLLLIKAEILKWSGRGEEALAQYRAAAAAARESLEAHYGLYRHAGSLRTEEAAAAAEEAMAALSRLRPENLVVLLRRGAAAIARGDRAAASQAYLRVKELSWQAQPLAVETLGKVLAALEAGDLEAARVPALRLENVLKVTPMFQQGHRELTADLQGMPVERFSGEPPPESFGRPAPVRFQGERLEAAPTAGRGLAVGDFDGDQATDVARIAGGRLAVRRAASGATAAGPAVPPGAANLLAADLDNDGRLDLLAHGEGGLAFLRGAGDGSFTAATAELGLAAAKGEAAAFFDFDIEGDLDLAVASAAGRELFRNSLSGPLEAVGRNALPALSIAAPRAALASDLDRDGDPDLVLAHDRGLAWLDNLRQGRFRDRTQAGGLSGAAGAGALASADFDNDGLPDLVAAGLGAGAGGGLSLYRNRGGRFERLASSPPLPATARVASLVAFDADNDGRLDLAAAAERGAAGPGGIWVLAQRGDLAFEPLPVAGGPAGASALAAADLDGDGDLDLVAAGREGLHRLANEGGNSNRWLAVRLRGLATGNSKNNVLGLGSTVEVRSGRAYQLREVQGDVTHLGLGSLPRAEVLRVTWTNGVPQNRLDAEGNRLVVEEQVLKGSCPFLYAWDGERMAFVTDLLWGAPLGLPVAPGAWAFSDPRELVAVPGAAPRGGSYEMALTEELWEAAFFDEVRLWVVDAPAEVEVASSLRIQPGEAVAERVLGARRVRPVAAAWDGRGEEVTARVAARDEVYAGGYEPSPYQGVARPWSFTFEVGEAPSPRPLRLLLDGWIFPADASLNLAAAQRRDLPYLPPRLEVETSGGWEVLLPSMGHPAGKTKTMVVDLPPLPAGARRLRIVTSLWLHWDRIAWTDEPDDGAPQVLARLSPTTAELRFRGFSAPLREAPNAPHRFDYARVSTASPWLPFPGSYTRYGEVRELLARADDAYAILAPGDEVALAFDARELPPPGPGMRRHVLLESFGWDKDADRNTFEAAQVEPLPWGAMTGYPPGPGEAPPDTPRHRAFREGWLTRRVEAAPIWVE